MEPIIFLALSVVSITLNLMVLSTLRSRPNEVELPAMLEAIEACGCSCPAVNEDPVTVEAPFPTPVLVPQPLGPKAVKESYYAWKNSTGEATTAPPSPHGPPPKPGPMERPYGFSR